ncbi:MAG: glycoside hydrolase family 13 protein [Lachnospiraceae bacterium]|nr:glycoside hydrolase family 13 protein [Lachnospiraceae bacterium]
MKLDAILHIPMSEYAYGLDEKHIVYKLRCARGDLKKVILNYGDTACRVTPIIFTAVTMEKIASDEYHDYWQAIVDSPYNRVYYYFKMDDGEQTVLYYGDVFTDHLVDDRSQYFKLPFNHRANLAKVPEWAGNAVVYNIFPDSFATSHAYISEQAVSIKYGEKTVTGKRGGTLNGITENIDYLLSLGITCVYLNPIFAAGEYHKYDLLDYYHVDPCFGGDEAFREMIHVLHSNGIKVIIDGVFNHCGWNFFAFDDVIRYQEESRYCDWFYHLEFPVTRPESADIYPSYACFAYERMMPKLNTENPEVREYFCKVGQYWVKEFGIDGWRLDVASEIDDGFWRAFRKSVKSVNPDAILIGEVWESAGHWLQGDIFDSTMNYDFRKHCNLFFAEGSIDAFQFSGRVTNMLMRYRVQMTQVQMNLLDSHDVGRFLSLCKGNLKRYRLAILFLMTFVGMPTVFYGDEQGIEGETEDEYRSSMPWESENETLLQFFQRAIAMRRELSALREGDFHTCRAQKGEHLFAFTRTDEGQKVTVYLNAGEQEAEFDIKECGEKKCYWSENLFERRLGGFGFAIFVDG